MKKTPTPVNKQKVYRVEENADHACFICSEKAAGRWRLVGFDEHGELWICQECWDLADDNSRTDARNLNDGFATVQMPEVNRQVAKNAKKNH